MRRAGVTGIGFITSIGTGREEVSRSLREGRNGIALHPELDRDDSPVKLAGLVPGFSFPETRPDTWEFPPGVEIPRMALRPMAPHCAYAWCAMREAIADAGLTPDLVSNPRTGAYCASGGSIWNTHEFIARMLEKGIGRAYPFGLIASISGTLNMNLASAFGIKGAALGFSSACSSSAHALGAALDQIRLGRQEIVFVVGAEDCKLHNILPFASLRALSTQTDPERFPCAFDRKRDGFVAAGGATVLVLEELGHAARRGARVYAEALGWGEASDGGSITAPDPDGDGMARAIRNALADARIGPGEIDAINAHAAGTPAGDVAEVRAIRSVWPEGETPWVSSTKSLTGHGLSLAGAMEAAFCCLGIAEGFVPVSAKITDLDPACAEARIVTRPVECRPGTMISNSSGFGGSNVALVFRRPEAG